MYEAHLLSHLYMRSSPRVRSVHPEYFLSTSNELDQRHRTARQREARQPARPQPPPRQQERQHVVHHPCAKHRVRDERRVLEHGAPERLFAHVRRCAHAEPHAHAGEEVQHGERGARLGEQLRHEVVVRVDEWEAREGGELGERVDEDIDEGEGNLEVLCTKKRLEDTASET
jgi:hypothetical protein